MTHSHLFVVTAGHREIMTIQSKSTKIDAENYVQFKQKANAKQAHNTNFRPFQPKKSIATPAQDPATSLVPTVTKKHNLKALPLDKRFMS